MVAKRKQQAGASAAHRGNGKHAQAVDAHAYPRPLMQRGQWINLNGPWEFAIDAEAKWRTPEEFSREGTIAVPFAPETPLSGINNTGFYNAVWYRRTVRAPDLDGGKRLLLHLGAVDYEARVWVNGKL